MTDAAGPELAVCSSNVHGDTPVSLALRDGTALHTITTTTAARRDLVAMAAELCAGAGRRPADLRALRIDRGPGSYVGLRVAVTFARTLHALCGLHLLACSSLELLAAAAGTTTDLIRPVLDGRRQRYHTAMFRSEAGRITTVEPPRAVSADELLGAIAAGQRVLAADALHDLLADRCNRIGAALQPLPPIDARTMFAPQLTLHQIAAEQLEPLYLMGSYAEP